MVTFKNNRRRPGSLSAVWNGPDLRDRVRLGHRRWRGLPCPRGHRLRLADPLPAWAHQSGGQGLPLPSLASRLILGLLVAFAVFPRTVGPAGYQDLYDFGRNYGGYHSPFPLVMAEGPGNSLYGVFPAGGIHNKGTIFRIGAAGGLATLHNFDGAHGSTPVGGLTLGPDGSLYGMAEHGSLYGHGNIFRVTPSGAFSVLYNFKGG